MKKTLSCLATLSVCLLMAMPGMAQRGLLGGRSSVGARGSMTSMGRIGTPLGGSEEMNSKAKTNAKMQERSNVGAKDKGLVRASTAQSSNTKADSKRDFDLAPGVGKAEAKTSSTTRASESTGSSMKANGLVQAQSTQSANTTADSKRDFNTAPGLTKADASTSSKTNVQEKSDANVNANGAAKAHISQSSSASAGAHTSVFGKIKHHLHL